MFIGINAHIFFPSLDPDFPLPTATKWAHSAGFPRHPNWQRAGSETGTQPGTGHRTGVTVSPHPSRHRPACLPSWKHQPRPPRPICWGWDRCRGCKRAIQSSPKRPLAALCKPVGSPGGCGAERGALAFCPFGSWFLYWNCTKRYKTMPSTLLCKLMLKLVPFFFITYAPICIHIFMYTFL